MTGFTDSGDRACDHGPTSEPSLLHQQSSTKLLLEGREIAFSDVSDALQDYGWSGATVDLP